jgi:hypothetical protein
VQTGRRDAGAGEFVGEIDREHDLRELALAVSACAAVAADQHHVGEIDRLLPGRGHVNDARRSARLEQRQQQPRQQEPGEIVDRKT